MKKVAGTHGVRSSDFFHTNVSLLKIGLLTSFLALFPSKALLELYPKLFA